MTRDLLLGKRGLGFGLLNYVYSDNRVSLSLSVSLHPPLPGCHPRRDKLHRALTTRIIPSRCRGVLAEEISPFASLRARVEQTRMCADAYEHGGMKWRGGRVGWGAGHSWCASSPSGALRSRVANQKRLPVIALVAGGIRTPRVISSLSLNYVIVCG